MRSDVPQEQADRDGYFIVKDLVSAGDCARFAERLQQYARGGELPTGVLLQREPALENGGAPRPAGGDVRKISGLYGDDLFRTLIQRDTITGRIRTLIGEELRLYRADALMKPPAVGSEKGVHQDSPYWPIQPMSLWSCWIPFDDATIENGCMMVIPGSHRAGPQHHVHGDDYVIPTEGYDRDALRAVPMARGTGLFFHSLLIHATAANTSARPRRAVTMSYLGPAHHYVGAGAAPVYPTVATDEPR